MTESPRLAQSTTITLHCDTDRQASLFATVIGQEADALSDDRSRATVSATGDAVRIDIRAADLIALRAACNTWCSLAGVADDVAGLTTT